jgi:hypothetical protein
LLGVEDVLNERAGLVVGRQMSPIEVDRGTELIADDDECRGMRSSSNTLVNRWAADANRRFRRAWLCRCSGIHVEIALIFFSRLNPHTGEILRSVAVSSYIRLIVV